MRFAPLILAFILAGCAAPGSKLGRLEFTGQVLNSAGKPVPNAKVEYGLPPNYGRSQMDIAFHDEGPTWRINETTTDGNGNFSGEMNYAHHATCWLMPPLGCFPKQIPKPFFGLRVISSCSRGYNVDLSGDKLNYKVHDIRGRGMLEPVGEEISAKVDEIERGWKTFLKIQLPEDVICQISL